MKAAIISLGSESSKWTATAMRKYFDEVDELNLKQIEIRFAGKQGTILYQGTPLGKYDCVFAKGSFRYAQILHAITTILESTTYMPIRPSAFTVSHDKLLTQIILHNKGVAMPATYLSASIEAAKKLLKDIKYPIVMKFPQGTQGKGVVFADSAASASSVLDAMEALRQTVIVQEYIDTGGVDLRAFVIGDRVVGAYQRKASLDENRANIHAGGKGEVYELDQYAKTLAVKTAEALGVGICGVDLLETAKGPVVLEANISPGLQGITEVTGLDIADKIAKYLFEQTKTRMSASHNAAQKAVLDGVNGKADPQELITNLHLRGEKIVLPELVTKITGFDEFADVQIKLDKGKLSIEKL